MKKKKMYMLKVTQLFCVTVHEKRAHFVTVILPKGSDTTRTSANKIA